MDKGIKYVAADNAGLIFTIETENGDIDRRADTVEDGIYFVDTYGIATNLYFSSSMDFASEYGFTNDRDAKEFFGAILLESRGGVFV